MANSDLCTDVENNHFIYNNAPLRRDYFLTFLRNTGKMKIFHRSRLARTEDTLWRCTGVIAEIRFEHAVRENVDFEWGTFGRAVR